YPVDPRGLVVFDTPIGPDKPPSIFVDQKMLQTRIGSLRTLADLTDGLAIVSSNNIAAGLKRVVDDLTSYYLLGYYASGKLDGKLRPGGRLDKQPQSGQSASLAPERSGVAARTPMCRWRPPMARRWRRCAPMSSPGPGHFAACSRRINRSPLASIWCACG